MKSGFDLDKIQELAADMSPSYCYLSEATRLFCLDLLTREPQERWRWRYEDEPLTDAQWDEAEGLVDLAIDQLMGLVSNLDDLDDITITEPGDNDLLAYDDGTSQWVNQTANEAGLATENHEHDHGDMGGLADDDHTQYHTDARGDARYPPLARTISTTSPLAGGGNLSANRTLTVGAASESAAGVAEIATQAEVDAGTDTARIVTPARLVGLAIDKIKVSKIYESDAGAAALSADVSGNLTATGTLILADDKWIGLGSSAGRIVFDNQATDEISILDANIGINILDPLDKLDVNGTVRGLGFRSFMATILDNNAVSLDPGTGNLSYLAMVQVSGNYWFGLNFAGTLTTIVNVGFNLVAGEGVLTGTTGVDGNISLRALNQVFYFENRSGFTLNVGFLIGLAGTP